MNLITKALLADQEPCEENLIAAAEFAEAQLKLLEIRKVRLELLTQLQSRQSAGFFAAGRIGPLRALGAHPTPTGIAKLPSVEK